MDNFKISLHNIQHHLQNDYVMILFDDECGLCQRFVSLIRRQSKSEILVFLSLQKCLKDQSLINELNLPSSLDSIVVLHKDKQYLMSTAISQILVTLGGGWWILGKTILVFPLCFRDFCYKKVAKYRYNLFCKVRK